VADVLAARDIEFARTFVPVARWMCQRWFRPEIEGMEKIPDGPVLFVGNHSGGSSTPDSVVLVLELIHRFGYEWPLLWLAHDLLMALPGLGDFLRRCGVAPARPGMARAALEAGAAVIVYPGGELELHRPWSARDEVRFEGRTGFARLAVQSGAPIVPVVSHGGHNTYLPLTDWRELAHRLGIDRIFGFKALPVSLAVPWGVNTLLPHLPLPARIRTRFLDPINVREMFGDDVGLAAKFIEAEMQHTLTELAAAES
jgi:1-acyl-sn-glycerol-3-phosphate acyltransferase